MPSKRYIRKTGWSDVKPFGFKESKFVDSVNAQFIKEMGTARKDLR